MTQQWTRQHDAHIARECEGLKPIREKGMPEHLWKWNLMGRHSGQVKADYLSHYSTDIAACIRAAESWVKAGPDLRIDFHVDRKYKWAQVCTGERWSSAHEETICAALAWALYRATGGME